MEVKWVCLTVSSSYHRGEDGAVASELQRIFGNDLKELRIVRDATMEKSGEYFAFVCCSDYFKHIDELRGSSAVLGVVPSYNSPSFLPQSEVEAFVDSAGEKPPAEEYAYGDMVSIGEEVVPSSLEHLSGLYGIVAGHGKRKGWVKVYFRFETRSFQYVISSSSLNLLGNVFETMHVPPFDGPVRRGCLFGGENRNKARKAVQTLVRRDKIRREQRRELEEPYNLC